MTQPAPHEGARTALMALRAEIAKVVVGQDAVVSGLVIALLWTVPTAGLLISSDAGRRYRVSGL